MADPARFRYRIGFAKLPAMRFTGHLDLHRTWERTLRRAGLPLAYTQGFSPHARIHLASALPLGYTSECELADVWLEEDWDPSAILQALRFAAPPGLGIDSVGRIQAGEPVLQQQVRSAEYCIQLEATNSEDIEAGVRSLLLATSLPRERRDKAYDLRPLIEELRVERHEHGGVWLVMRLAAREAATGRPEEVLLAMGLDPAAHQSRRTRLFMAEPEAALQTAECGPSTSDPHP